MNDIGFFDVINIVSLFLSLVVIVLFILVSLIGEKKEFLYIKVIFISLPFIIGFYYEYSKNISNIKSFNNNYELRCKDSIVSKKNGWSIRDKVYFSNTKKMIHITACEVLN